MYIDSSPSKVILRLAWNAVRLPVLMALLMFQPLINFIFTALAMLGILMSFFFKAVALPHFPFWTMLSISLGFGVLVLVYQALVHVLSE